MSLNIRRVIEARKMTNKEVAARLDISKTTMQTFLSPGATPSLSTLNRIAAILDCDVVELFDEPAVRTIPRATATPPDQSTASVICPHCGTVINVSLTK